MAAHGGAHRHGALRCPSEVLNLTWQDVDWQNQRIHVHASKTEHHEDGGDRVVPMFTELKPLLQAVWELAPEGSNYVIERNRKHTNVGTKLRRIIRLAGLKPWPKPFHNMRATSCTELERAFPSHVVTSWCGHSERIAEAHYWMTTDQDFLRAASEKVTTLTQSTAPPVIPQQRATLTDSPEFTSAEDVKVGAYWVQQGNANGGNGLQAHSAENEKSPDLPGSAVPCDNVQGTPLEDNGFEPMTSCMP